jgi:phage-related minor tail protein
VRAHRLRARGSACHARKNTRRQRRRPRISQREQREAARAGAGCSARRAQGGDFSRKGRGALTASCEGRLRSSARTVRAEARSRGSVCARAAQACVHLDADDSSELLEARVLAATVEHVGPRVQKHLR